MHHASLEEVFEELVVDEPTAGFDFDNESFYRMISIRVESFLETSVQSKKDWHADPCLTGFATLDSESELLKTRSEVCQHVIAEEVVLRGSDLWSGGFKYADHLPSESSG